MSPKNQKNLSETHVNIKVPNEIALVIVDIARSIKDSNPELFVDGNNKNEESPAEDCFAPQPDTTTEETRTIPPAPQSPAFAGDTFKPLIDSCDCRENARGPLGMKSGLAWIPYLVCIVLAVFGLLSIIGAIMNESVNRHHDAAQVHSESTPSIKPVESAQIDKPAQPTHQPEQGKPLTPDDRIEIVMGHATDNAHKMFVFTDPVCPYCKKTEPFLEKLSREGYEIHLFPTPIHQASYPMINSLACYFTKQNVDVAQRVEAWESEINRGILPITDDAKCPDKDMMVDVNARAMRFFGQFGFNATPTLVNGHGVTHVGAFDNEHDLAAFANQEK